MLKRRKESDTYLTTDSRHRRSPQIAMRVSLPMERIRNTITKSNEIDKITLKIGD